MELNGLTLIIVTALITLAIAGAIIVFSRARKANPDQDFKENFASAWNKIRPILSELFINLFNLYQADKGGFEELLHFSVDYVYNKVQEADFLLPEEKQILTRDLITTLLEPKLREMYEKKYSL